MSDLIERMQVFVDEGPDPTVAPYVLGEHHIQAYKDAIERIERLEGTLGEIADDGDYYNSWQDIAIETLANSEVENNE